MNITTAGDLPFPVDPGVPHFDAQGCPWVNGHLLKVPRRERSVLSLLVERHPHVVSKDEFAERVWCERAMSDEGLAMCISRIRRALDGHGWSIAVEYGIGYRLHRQVPAYGAMPQPPARHGYAHARQLLEQRSPAAVGVVLRLLREVLKDEPTHGAARVALADALAIAIGWGLEGTDAGVDEGLAALAQVEDMGLRGAVEGARGALLDLAWRFDEAQRCFERALALDPADTRTLVAFSRHQLYMDQPAAAIETLQRVRRLTPHALAPRWVLARALVLTGRGTEAIAEVVSASQDHPTELAAAAFELSIRAVVAPQPALKAAASRLMEGTHTPTFVWSMSSYVLARLRERAAALDIIDAVLLCSRTSVGEATLYAAPLAELGHEDRACDLLEAAYAERCGMLAMVLRDPGNQPWLAESARGSALLAKVFGSPARPKESIVHHGRF